MTVAADHTRTCILDPCHVPEPVRHKDVRSDSDTESLFIECAEFMCGSVYVCMCMHACMRACMAGAGQKTTLAIVSDVPPMLSFETEFLSSLELSR